MHRLAAALLIFTACSRPQPSAQSTTPLPQAPITDLTFNDTTLNAIATSLVREAHRRGIETSAGRNKIERLLSLESALQAPDQALARVNKLVSDMLMTDGSQWAKLRRRAQGEFASRSDQTAQQINGMFARWQRRRLDIIFDYLSSNYTVAWIRTAEWERRFHEFLRERPMDAATWGWLVLRENRTVTQAQYGRADAEMGYRYYLESTGLGDGREAREIFSVPGVDLSGER